MHRPLNEQVVVVTGASSGIGRETARHFGRAGAQVVLAARNEQALLEAAIEIELAGGKALAVPTDVSDAEQVRHLARTAVEKYGRIDTWVNNAGISVYATADETTEEEAQRVMQVNFFGIVNGVNAVLPYMKAQGGGTIINVGSVESKRALPLQAVYAASKHAVRGYTDALRMEQMHARTGVKVTLIMPSGINTPLFDHARSKTGLKPRPVPPVYEPDLVARSIVSAAASPQRDITVGGGGFMLGLMNKISPGLLDRIMTTGGMFFRMQLTKQPASERDNMFHFLPGSGRVRGNFGKETKRSFYTPVFELAPRLVRGVAMLAVPVVVAVSVLARMRGR
jgi:NAD(P)-dependent dehydrogenase (short-subunit alcohol dehydrogenase family)